MSSGSEESEEHSVEDPVDKDDAVENDDLPVELGFILDDCSRLHRRYFPSKVGGLPAWLIPRDLPGVSELTCSNCEDVLTFLLQVYAPLEGEERAGSYHRMLYVFCCKKGGCNNAPGSIKVLRSQLPLENEYYPMDGVADDEEASSARTAQGIMDAQMDPLCAACGLSGPSTCGKCRKVRYCSRQHQVAHWKAGHKKACGGGAADAVLDCLFKQYEIEIDEEPPFEERETELLSDRERELVDKYTAKMHKLKENKDAVPTTPIHDAEEIDPALVQFQLRIASNQDQIMRYSRHADAAPLWVGTPDQLAGGPPPCDHCGGKRIFELQILPQLLFYIQDEGPHDDLVDWGTIAVYTCERSCHTEHPYVSEYFHKQHMRKYK